MTSIMDFDENGIDPQAEVRKLQDLVKKLETQNEVLRQKQKLGDSNENEIIKDGVKGVNNSIFYNTRKRTETPPEKKDLTQTNNSLESIELIDVDKSLTDLEDSWLYSSPRPPTPQQNRMSPYKWVRQDFDHPSPVLQSARKSLRYKLEEAARMSRSSSTPAFQNYTTPPSGSPAPMSVSADATPSPRIMTPKAHGTSALNSRLQGNRVHTGTFTRPKRSRDRPSPEEAPRSPPVYVEDGKENVEAIHHTNVTDIENLAKLQEESLRQSMAQTSPRRGFRSRPLPNAPSTDNNSSSADSNRSSPIRYEVDGMNRRDSHNSVGSDQSSPPDSPYGSSQHLHQSGSSNLRGSLPNVSGVSRLAMPRAQHHNSDSSLADYPQEENYSPPPDPSRYTSSRVQNQLQRPSSPSVSGLKQPNRNLRGASPQRSGLPTPARRSIPRPGSAGTPRSSLPSPRRISGLPAAPRAGQYPQKTDDSWREGCF